MRNTLFLAVTGLGIALVATGGRAEDRKVGFLTKEPSSRDPLSIALDYIRADGARRGLAAEDLRDAILLSRTVSRHNQTTHIHLRQRFEGIEVANANTSINV